jgi:hypothetical protein
MQVKSEWNSFIYKAILVCVILTFAIGVKLYQGHLDMKAIEVAVLIYLYFITFMISRHKKYLSNKVEEKTFSLISYCGGGKRIIAHLFVTILIVTIYIVLRTIL